MRKVQLRILCTTSITLVLIISIWKKMTCGGKFGKCLVWTLVFIVKGYDFILL